MSTLTPREIVAELDKFVVGQEQAKRMVAVAVRNRWRRQHLPEELRDEVAPKNIIMMGPTGVGKTEIARRLAKLSGAPFIKVEATKFTEVGYVGRDVESMVRDLMEDVYKRQFLHSTGLGKFFIDLALAAAGRYVGGPAKVAVLASGFFGTISGSSVANTVSTGTFTLSLIHI